MVPVGGRAYFEIGERDEEGARRTRRGFAGNGGRADKAVDAEGGVFELIVRAGHEGRGNFAAGYFFEVARRQGFEFDTEEVGGLIAEVGDTVAPMCVGGRVTEKTCGGS
jgi:hypothetical protein